MKHYPHIVSKVYRQPWLITPAQHRSIQRLIESRVDGATDICDEENEEPEIAIDGSTAVIPVHGIIGKHLQLIERMCGGMDLDSLNGMIDRAMESDEINTLLFDFRSPGGTITGVPEMGRKIANLSKKTIAFTDEQCCSSALWLASQCGSFYCTPSSDVGSVGVYSVYVDASRAYENQGVKINAISAGEYKLTGADFKPMTPDELTMLQSAVDKIYSQFKEAVTRNRSIDDKYMQGQVFDGEQAVEYGFCDGLVESITDLLD